MNTTNKRTYRILEDQAVGEYVLHLIRKKAEEKACRLSEIAVNTENKENAAMKALQEAISYIEKARDFVSPGNLSHILGPNATKHGEIAENLEVNFRNGRNVLRHLKAVAQFLMEGKDRIGPTDFVVDGTPVQSKFINGDEFSAPNKSLTHVFAHLKKYPGYATDASPYGFPGQKGVYFIPKDQYETLQKVITGNTEGLSYRTVKTCKALVSRIEEETGRPITDVVKSGVADYKDVQLGRVDATIDAEERSYYEAHEEESRQIRKEDEQQREKAQHITDASWREAFKAAGVGAAISGVFSAGSSIFLKMKKGKRITDFTLDDWKDVGLDFAKGGLKGGISGVGIYGLTKLAGISAPLAGSMVTMAIGITSLFIDYQQGRISQNDFADASLALSIEAGLAAFGAVLGQLVIPIPEVGGIVGTIAAQITYKYVAEICGKSEGRLVALLERNINNYKAKLNLESQRLVEKVNSYYDRLEELIEKALSLEPDVCLGGSVELARLVGVDENLIIADTSELDVFMA